MTLKGNYRIMFLSQLFTGIVSYPLCLKFDILGILIAFIPFLIGMILVLNKHTPDEREKDLLHKANSVESIGIGLILSVVYMFFPNLNWFYVFLASISIVRGIAGIILFTIK